MKTPVTFVLFVANGADTFTHVACTGCERDASNPDDGKATYMASILIPDNTLDFWEAVSDHLAVAHPDADHSEIKFTFMMAKNLSWREKLT